MRRACQHVVAHHHHELLPGFVGQLPQWLVRRLPWISATLWEQLHCTAVRPHVAAVQPAFGQPGVQDSLHLQRNDSLPQCGGGNEHLWVATTAVVCHYRQQAPPTMHVYCKNDVQGCCFSAPVVTSAVFVCACSPHHQPGAQLQLCWCQPFSKFHQPRRERHLPHVHGKEPGLPDTGKCDRQRGVTVLCWQQCAIVSRD